MPRPIKKTVEQTLDYQASYRISAAHGAGEDQALLLYRKLVMFLYSHALLGNVHLIGSISPDSASFEISLTSRTVLSGTATKNVRVFEGIWNFFEENGFRFTVVLGDARAESPDPGELGTAGSKSADDQLVADLGISECAKAMLRECRIMTVGEIRSSAAIDLLDICAGPSTKLIVALKIELAGLGIFFSDDPRAELAPENVAIPLRKRVVEFGKAIKDAPLDIAGLAPSTRNNLRNNGIFTLGDLLRHTTSEVAALITPTEFDQLILHLRECKLHLYQEV